LRPGLVPATVSLMTAEHKVIEAELHRSVLDEEHMAEKRADQPDLPARELSPELWTVIWGWDHEEEDGKDHQVVALVGLVLAKASICGHGGASVSWTLTGTPPEGRTLPETVADLGVTLHERWPPTWR
jgi:hypothetical protein